MSEEELKAIEAAYLKAMAEMPRNVAAAKRVHVSHSEWLEDWWVGWGKDDSCQIEGTQNHWRWLALILLGLADPKDRPYDEDKQTPEIVPALIAEVRRLRKLVDGG